MKGSEAGQFTAFNWTGSQSNLAAARNATFPKWLAQHSERMSVLAGAHDNGIEVLRIIE